MSAMSAKDLNELIDWLKANPNLERCKLITSMTKKTTLKELGEMLGFVVQRLATKDDITDLRREIATKTTSNASTPS